MNKLKFFLVCVLLSLGLSAQAKSHAINPNWSDLSQVQYIDNLVACELALQRHKWSLNVWPETNSKPKPDFSEVVDVDKVWQQVIDNLTLQSILAENFNTIISDEMLQHDLDRMASNSKDAKGLKALFSLFDNNPQTIAQCISRPYLVKQKTQNNFNFNVEIHTKTKVLARSELQDYLNGSHTDELKAQVSTTTYEIEKAAIDIENDLFEDSEPIIQLSNDEFEKKVQQLEVSGLQENESAYFYTEILEQSDNRIKVKTLSWNKASFDIWLRSQNADIYFPELKQQLLKLPTITGSNNLSAFKSGAIGGSWESKYYAPDGRIRHSAIWSGSEMIIWGGSSNGIANSGGRYNPTTDSWIATSDGTNVPSPRYYHSAIWSGAEMIIWGGYAGGFNIYNTGGRYNPITDSWLATSVTVNVPSGRSNHTSIWTGSEMIVWGGRDYGNNLNTGGRYDPIDDSWEPMSMVNAPSARHDQTAIWTDNEMIIWGGSVTTGGGFANTGGRYNPDTDIWITTSTGANAPSGRNGHTAIWTGSEMIVWGGHEGTFDYFNSGGRYNPTTDSWIATSTETNAPSARSYHTAIWDGSEMVIWGGFHDSGNNSYIATNSGARYSPSTDNWIATNVGTNVPSPKREHTAIWTGIEMIVWGGHGGNYNGSNTGGRYNPVNDSWSATSVGVNVPSARHRQTAIWTGSEMIVWGGSIYTNSGGRYNPATDSWLTTSVGTDVPSERYWHSAIWTGSEMIIWGGFKGTFGYLNSGGRYNPNYDSWIATSVGVNVPSARYYHTAIWSGTEMIAWGGFGYEGSYKHLNSGGRYNPDTDSWTVTSMGANVPSGRDSHSAIWANNEMIVWGGYDGSSLDSGGLYNPMTNSWEVTSKGTNVPNARHKHTAVWDGDQMIVWGGNTNGYDTTIVGGRYDPNTDTWSATSTVNIPDGRSAHTAIWNGSEMIVWGGHDSDQNRLNTGGRYDPVTNSWIATSLDANVPTARDKHTAIWTGTQMLIWGGSTGLPTNSLGIYYPYDNYSISGTLSGLVGNQVTLQNNGGDDLTLTTNGAFQFNGTLAEGLYYEITVLSNPQSPAQSCTVTNGSGYITADVSDVLVQCNTLVDLIFRNGFESGPADLIFRDGFEGL